MVYVYQVREMNTGQLRLIKENAEAYQIYPEDWKSSPAEAIAYYEACALDEIRDTVNTLKEKLQAEGIL